MLTERLVPANGNGRESKWGRAKIATVKKAVFREGPHQLPLLIRMLVVLWAAPKVIRKELRKWSRSEHMLLLFWLRLAVRDPLSGHRHCA